MIHTIHQSTEILPRDDQLAIIEKAGRTCYRSEHKIHDDSALKFVKNIIKSKHYSVLEHGILCFAFKDTSIRYFLSKQKFINQTDDYVSGNYRAWLELISSQDNIFIDAIKESLSKINPDLFEKNPEGHLFKTSPDYYLEHIPEAEISSLPKEERLMHQYVSVKIITDRAMSHEIVRHRNNLAISQESQRYVNYNKKELQFIIQVDIKEFMVRQQWIHLLMTASETYKSMLKMGVKPEIARSVLPNATKTELILTASVSEWNHIFNLRCSAAAHPQIRALMTNLKKQFIKHEQIGVLLCGSY
jgi:thymidylate synthase (FAD)